MTPKIINIDEIKAIGMQHVEGEIAQMWPKFLPRSVEISSSLQNGIFYGFQGCVCKGDCKCESKYIACLAVSSFDGIPDGMVGWTIPGGEYAVFTYKGIPEALDDSFDANIYGKWLPAAGYEPSAKYYVEVYDHRFKLGSEDSEVDLYVPVKKMCEDAK